MKSMFFLVASTLSLLIVTANTAHAAQSNDGKTPDQSVTVAAYYYGNWHPGDPRNAGGKNWSEWEVLKAAKPRFPGHQQPKVPLWGYTDESDPKVMAQKIDAAADHGIDAFIFDWYYFNEGPSLERPVERGFLGASNNRRLKFALMWANDDMTRSPETGGPIPVSPIVEPEKVLFSGIVTPETFSKVGDYVIQKYFLHPSYWRIEGKPYFSFYALDKLVSNFGSVQATRRALDQFRAKAVAAGLPGLHLNLAWAKEVILPGEKATTDVVKLIHDLGFDSVTSYTWKHDVPLPKLQTDYAWARDHYFAAWDEMQRIFEMPYIPNVTMGWDGTPRGYQYFKGWNGGNIVSGNTPQQFEQALRLTKQRILANKGSPPIVTINAWNEWTEGSYLEPDSVHGMQYLDAVRAVFRPADASMNESNGLKR